MQGCAAQKLKLEENKDDNTMLWEISGNGLKKPSYLYGTFHLMCKDDILISEQLKKAMQASDEVYFEMDLDDPTSLLGGVFFMNMKDGITLKDLYSEEDYQRLETYFNDSLGMPMIAFQKMKPMMLQAMLYPKMLSCSGSSSGVEMELLKIAAEYKKEVKGFETIQQQSSFFDSIPYDVQAKELLKSIDSVYAWGDEFEKMLSVYKEQKLMEIENLFTDSEITVGENKSILLDNRNIDWVKQMKVIMKKNGIFAAVGAGHLPGDMGVIQLLKNEGYTLRPILNN